MAGVLEGVDQRTRLAGENRMELLLFRLGGQQLFGINVFKVQEVIQCPTLTSIPNSNPIMYGLAYLRGRTIPVLDLGKAIGKGAIKDVKNCFVIVAEYNQSVQGFLVSSVDRIVNMKWEEIKAPPKGLGIDNYMTAVTRVDEKLVEIIDVEKVLVKLIGIPKEIPGEQTMVQENDRVYKIFVVDDSSVARNQIKRTLDSLGMETILANNGREGLDMLKKICEKDRPIQEQIDLIISDVEMPEMDGYTLTTEIRKHPKLKLLPVILHTSLSGQFNSHMVESVGADKFIPKFSAKVLSEAVLDQLGVPRKTAAIV